MNDVEALRFQTAPASLDEAEFMARFGGIYEHSPWVASTIWTEGVTAADDAIAHLAGRMRDVVESAAHETRLALLRAHPELAGKLAVAGELTAESKSEQAGAGLDQCSAAEFERFQQLNSLYGDRFGHPFIIAVKGLDRQAILAAFEARTSNTPEAEFTTAMTEVHKIARLRLEAMGA